MRRAVALVLPLLGVVAVACPGPKNDFSVPELDAEPNPPDAPYQLEAGPPQPVRVMSWNAGELFDDRRDSPQLPASNSPGGACNTSLPTACEKVLSTADYQTKLTQVSNVISKLGPDVVMLQEVENKPVVDDLSKKLGGYVYRYVALGNDVHARNVAVLSQLDFQIGPSHKDDFFAASTSPGQSFLFSHNLLELHFLISGRQLALLGVHFAEQTGDPTSDLRRLAEAQQTRKIADGILKTDPRAAIVVLGDFNCTPGSDPMNAIAGQAPSAFTSATVGLPTADRWSVDSGGPELFDDQLLDPNAASLLDPGSVAIVHTDADANATSGHDPIYATYTLH